MKRLIKDAAALDSSIDANSMSFANIVKAINVVQTEMGITGTTAKEAASTIQGSVGMMKSSWTNLVTGIADENANLDVLITNFVDSVGTVAQNIVPKIGVALNSASKLISDLIPVIVHEIPVLIEENLPILAEAAISIIQSLVDGISENQEMLMITAFDTIVFLANSLISMLPQIVALGLDLIVSLANGIAESLPELIPTIMDVIMQIVHILTDPANLTNLLNAALAIITELAYGLMDAIPQLVQAVSDIIIGIADFLVDPTNLGMILKAALDVVIALAVGLVDAIPVLLAHLPKMWAAIINNFKDVDWGELGKNIVDGLLSGLKRAWDSLKKWFSNAWDGLVGGVKDLLGIHSPSRVFAGIGENMALGLGEGWEDEFGGIKKGIENEMDFGVANIDVGASMLGRNSSVLNSAFSNFAANLEQNATIVVQSVLDGKIIGETAYQYSRTKAKAYGV